MRRSAVALIVLCSTFAAGPGEARSGRTREPGPRIFVGASGAAAWLSRADDSFSNSVVDTRTDQGFGASLTYGASVAGHFSGEIDFEWIEGHDIHQTTALGSVDAKLTTYVLSSTVGWHPFRGRIDPFAGFGAGWMHAAIPDMNASGDGAVLRWTTGVNLWLSESLGLRLEGRYTMPITKQIKDFDSVAPRAGVFYRF